MLTRRIIPCLDVSHGRVVKGIRFQGLRDAGDPAERAALYEAQGADEIVILDVSATPEGRGNQVEPQPGCRFLAPGYAYFANSYRVIDAPGCRIATAEHGGRFVAALERDQVVACQFHPELSGAYGHRLIARWLEGV